MPTRVWTEVHVVVRVVGFERADDVTFELHHWHQHY